MSKGISRLGVFVGGMRCGSTAINDYLKQHPEVCVHSRKDPHFFSGKKNWLLGWDHYLEGWSHFDSERHKIAFESSTHYTKYPLYKPTAKRMASSPYDMRLIYGVQDPLARVESHFIHNTGKGYLNPHDATERRKLLEQAVNVSNYDLQVARFERYFSHYQLMVLRTRDLISRPMEVLEAICDFLGIDSSYEFEKISRRPRRFKHDFEAALLTDAEKSWAASLLREPIMRFQERYDVVIWDGEQYCNE